MKSDLHEKLQNKGLYYLRNKSYWVSHKEIRIGSIIDVWGISPSQNYECCAIEVKVSRNDFRSRSQYFKNINADSIANLCYILCPKNLIQPNEVHENWGLLWYHEETDRISCKKMPNFKEMSDRLKLVALTNFLWSGINVPRKPLTFQELLTKNRQETIKECVEIARGKYFEGYQKGVDIQIEFDILDEEVKKEILSNLKKLITK